jgi:predicted site-specific integrase-resolvase
MTEKFMKLSAVAKMLGVSKQSVARWEKNGDLQGIRLPSGLVVIAESALQEFIHRNEAQKAVTQ